MVSSGRFSCWEGVTGPVGPVFAGPFRDRDTLIEHSL